MNDKMNIDRAVEAFHVVSDASKAMKAFEWIAAYKADTGHRPSLSSIVMLWQESEAKLAALQAKVDALVEAGGPLDE